MKKNVIATLVFVLLAASAFSAAEEVPLVLNISTGELQPGMKVRLKIAAEYNVIDMAPPGTKDHALRAVPAERIRVRVSADKTHSLEFVAPPAEINGRRLEFRMARDLVRAGDNQFSAVVFRTEFTVRLRPRPGEPEHESSGVVNLATRWDPDQPPLVRCLRLDSAAGRPFQIALLDRCDDLPQPAYATPSTK
jgi:hypothetical protein